MSNVQFTPEIIERFARAWASIDGKLAEFKIAKVNEAFEEMHGTYGGYMTEAEELLKRADCAVTVP